MSSVFCDCCSGGEKKNVLCIVCFAYSLLLVVVVQLGEGGVEGGEGGGFLLLFY